MGGAALSGTWQPCKEQALEAVAVFDGKGFRLELLDGAVMNLRCATVLRSLAACSPPPPPPSAAAAAAAA